MPMPPDGEIQRRLREYESPRYGYRRGADGEIEKDLFDGVLPDGWTDSPAKVGPHISDTMHHGTEDGAAGDSDPHGYEAMTFPQLRAEMKRLTGKGPRPGMTRGQIVEQLQILGPGDAA